MDPTGREAVRAWRFSDPTGREAVRAWHLLDPTGREAVRAWRFRDPTGREAVRAWHHARSKLVWTVRAWLGAGVMSPASPGRRAPLVMDSDETPEMIVSVARCDAGLSEDPA